MLGGRGGNHGHGGKQWQPIYTARFMASVTCGLIALDRDQLQNPVLVLNMGYLYLDFVTFILLTGKQLHY